MRPQPADAARLDAGRPDAGRAGRQPARGGIHTVLDIGATRIACLLAVDDPTMAGAFRLAGFGQSRPLGFSNGVVTDLQPAERSIRRAVADAEQMAGLRAGEVLVSVSGPQLRGERVEGDVAVRSQRIEGQDVLNAIQDAQRRLRLEGRKILHVTPVGYMVDGVGGIQDPRGMDAHRLAAGLHVITAPAGLVANLERVVQLADLVPQRFVAAPYAAALGAIVEDERLNGVIVIEFGASATSVCVFEHGHLQRLEVLPEGGGDVTRDLAAALNCTLPAAERVKLAHGSAVRLTMHADDLVETPRTGDDGRLTSGSSRRGELAEICAQRVEDILFKIHHHLVAWGCDRPRSRRVVLTGGGAELPAIKEVAARMLQQQVRVGSPLRLNEAGGEGARPSLAASAGMLRLAIDPPPEIARGPVARPRPDAPRDMLRRAADWLRDFY